MTFKLRTIIVGLVSLGALLAMYVLYSGITQTPQMDINKATGLTESAGQGDAGDFDSELGKVGQVGVGAVKKFEYLHRNDNGDVDRKFGFRELLHQSKGQWETDKPFMEIFSPVKCSITADRGRVQVEDAARGLSVKDATFTGNVVMHIVPGPNSDIKESFIYLDDIAFDSKKSQFFTPGPVRFVSEDGQMKGRGLELIYNDALTRVELFRIIDLDSFRVIGSPAGLFAQRPASAKQAKTHNLSINADPNGSSKTGSPQKGDPNLGEYYRCVFYENVAIDSPEHLVFADSKVSINNIFWSRASGKKTGQTLPADSNNIGPVSTPVPTVTEPNKPAEESEEIVITCDRGVIIAPMSAQQPTGSEELSSDQANAARKLPADFNDAPGKPTTIARIIDYDVSAGDAILGGPVEIDFYADMNDLVRPEAGKRILPVKVTAQKEAKFLPASNQVLLKGNCVGTMLLADPNVQQKYTLSAETFTIDLLEDVSYQSRLRAGDIKYLTANGGLTRLTIFKTAGQELLGGVELQCRRIDYDAGQQLFVATGPGKLVLDNSKVTDPSPKPAGFSLRKPCYAFLQFFDTLNYYMKTNRIVADAKPQETLQIDYFPVVQDQYYQQAVATAGHVEISLVEGADGRNELATVTATDAVTYTDQDNQFSGGHLFYDREKSQLLVQGDDSSPCYFNGALVQSITYDLKTGKVQAPLAGPGAVQIKR